MESRSDQAEWWCDVVESRSAAMVACARRGDLEGVQRWIESIDSALAELALIRMAKMRARESG
jgi:hypothetical protein